MKICMLTTGHIVLDNRIFYKEALTLKKKYDDVVIIVPDERREFVERGIKFIGVKKPQSLFGRFMLGKEVVKRAIEEKADVYHFHDFEMIYSVLKIKKYLPEAKIIYDVHEHYPDMARMSKKIPSWIKPLATFFIDKSEIIFSHKFDFIITADDAVKQRFKEHHYPTEVIYNFSDFTVKETISLPKEYDVIYQGGITLERGVFNVVKAIEIAKATFPNIRMVFVGPFDDQKSKEMVSKYIKEHELSENIRFTGRIPHIEVEEYIRKSKIGVVTLLPFPKYFKNIPIKQFEYMSCGVPVIGSDLPPIRSFLETYNSGLIVDPTKPSEISAAIVDLLSHEEKRKQLGQNGILAVSEAYNWGKMEEKLYQIYGTVYESN